jgi:cytochrome c oxidase assembly protein subunit 15
VNLAPQQFDSPWPHRWAVALVCATFPMIWIGGLVTSYGAGMAVPDWPNTYGYNLFLYPWQTWIFGPWKLFIEHGHRLLGTVVGMLTIALLASAWRTQARPVVRVLSVVALVGVVFQGALGGMRVIEDEVQLAKVHGCVAPAFFALTVALAAITSRRWQQLSAGDCALLPNLGAIQRVALATTLLAYCQLVLGSQLRHLSTATRAGEFRVALFFHLAVAGVLVVEVALLAWQVFRAARHERWLTRPTLGLVLLIVFQVALGATTWVAKYGWPAWMSDYSFAARHVVGAESGHQAATATAHVAVGSLLLATSLLVALRSLRLGRAATTAPEPRWTLEAAR